MLRDRQNSLIKNLELVRWKIYLLSIFKEADRFFNFSLLIESRLNNYLLDLLIVRTKKKTIKNIVNINLHIILTHI